MSILPSKRLRTLPSSELEELFGSAKRSPRIMARENWVLEWSFESFSKKATNCPSMEPVMMLKLGSAMLPELYISDIKKKRMSESLSAFNRKRGDP